MVQETERDVRTRASQALSAREAHLFVILEGGRPAVGGGLRCSLRAVREVLFGRGEVRRADHSVGPRRLTICLPDPRISTKHAQLTRVQTGWRIEDAGSTNGTFVNGARVTDHVLSDGDVIVLGWSVLCVRLALPTTEETPLVSDGRTPSTETLGVATLLPALANELALLGKAAAAKVPILLLGDTGTGKEVVARAVHAFSKRPGEFVAINCAAIPDGLIEAQLFGHSKGAFSGATRDEIGFVRRSHRGTLFLDEIGDLPKVAQGVLLRLLQEEEVVPVGTTRPLGVDLRVIAATHRPIVAMTQREEFRLDLFARLQGFSHQLWPLANRREDLGLLISDVLKQVWKGSIEEIRIAPDAARALVAYRWPLNVRELVQALAYALPLSDDGVIDTVHLPPAIAARPSSLSSPIDAFGDLSEQDIALRKELQGHLRERHGNVAAVAREMKKAPMQIYRWMRQLGIDPRRFR